MVSSSNRPEWNDYKSNVQNYRDNRATEVTNNIQNRFDNYFSSNWWKDYGGYSGRDHGNYWSYADKYASYYDKYWEHAEKYWWWGTANRSEEQPPAPMPAAEGKEAEYLPLGVWALVQEEKGDAYMFFQISIDKNGVVSGAYKNLLSGEVSPISGQVDKKTQRLAWKIGSNSTVIEAGLQNLTQDVASCLVHFDTDTAQTWLLVRLEDPDIPNATQSGPLANDQSFAKIAQRFFRHLVQFSTEGICDRSPTRSGLMGLSQMITRSR